MKGDGNITTHHQNNRHNHHLKRHTHLHPHDMARDSSLSITILSTTSEPAIMYEQQKNNGSRTTRRDKKSGRTNQPGNARSGHLCLWSGSRIARTRCVPSRHELAVTLLGTPQQPSHRPGARSAPPAPTSALSHTRPPVTCTPNSCSTGEHKNRDENACLCDAW